MTTETEGRLDLSRLAFDRGPTASATRKPRHRQSRGRFLARIVLPGLILVGFATMAGWAARDLLRPTKRVTVVPVVVRQAEVHRAGTPLFQAAGWVEPRPTATFVSSLASGVVEELLVVSGQRVEAGETIARLVTVDAELAVESAEADLSLAEAAVGQVQAELTAAEQLFQNPLTMQATLAEAESLLAETESELAGLPSRIDAAEARLRFARQQLDGRRAARDAIAERSLQESESQTDGAAAELAGLKTRQETLPRQVKALQHRRDTLARQLDLRIEEGKRLAAAKADVQATAARRRQAEVALEVAKLRMSRMVVKSPMDGRVLALVAGPGTFVTGQEAQSNPQASAIVSLYDPAMLQVRADVRLEDVPRVTPGQPVIVETGASVEPIHGMVLEATSSANVQKNTLEVKVALVSPPQAVRPEMLVKATFLAPPTNEEPSSEEQKRERILVPRRLVDGEGESRTVWVAAADGTARRRSVSLGEAGTESLVEVAEGLRPTDRLIVGGRESLEDGDRIEITGEDASA
ncbi:MAG: HlyD family efflux transporter periplasmic adaptor subunit [Planctomycetaceae bacterium]|nr:HlyD family efflux transporter periplasmic adaptor subunit [Planctomycetaceae bacterium]